LTTAALWQELGIAPCRDRKAIRRAYAVRLKQLDPDRNPEAFARLRHAFEWALSRARQEDRPAAAPPPADPDGAEPVQESAEESAEESAGGSAAEADDEASKDDVRPQADLQPSAPALDRDDIRDRALLVALDAALQQRDAAAAMALYYRAAATGALSLQHADVIGRVLAVAVDDVTLGGAAFRRLIRTIGLDASWSRARIDGELRRRVLARIRAEDWYDDLLATAQQRKGQNARHRAKIARLVLGRIGRYWHPSVDKTALRSWLAQYNTHAAWLADRIDPAWPRKLERRLRRREMFWLALYVLFFGNVLIQAVVLFAVSVVEGDVDFWAVAVGTPFFAIFLWIFVLLAKRLVELANPGFRGFSAIVPWRAWRARIRTIWKRSKARETGDVG
jgi:hypothetical protein